MNRRLVVASVIAVVMTAACLTGSGVGSSAVQVRGAQAGIPVGLAAAIHARLGLGPIRLADSPTEQPMLGFAVALSQDGTTALVSAPGAHNQNGAVYVYHVANILFAANGKPHPSTHVTAVATYWPSLFHEQKPTGWAGFFILSSPNC